MNRCLSCNIDIADETEICPLCGSVLKQDEGSKDMYPDIRYTSRKLAFLVRIYMFLAIVLEVFLITINIKIQSSVFWSGIVGLCLLYGFVILRFAVLGENGYRFKTLLSVLIGVSILIAIDYLTGYRGWAVTYAVPCAIIAVDITIIILMIVNFRNWQSYMMLQLFMIVCSGITTLLLIPGIVRKPLFALCALAVSSFLFLGTLIIGDRKARIELKRRFHI